MKKVIIAGAGIAGLTAGIYALQSGFDVTIYESHTIPRRRIHKLAEKRLLI